MCVLFFEYETPSNFCSGAGSNERLNLEKKKKRKIKSQKKTKDSCSQNFNIILQGD